MLRSMASVTRVVQWRRIAFQFAAEKEQIYIPLRTLKEERNVLFDIGPPEGVHFSNKILIYTPFLAVALDGFINEWTNWRIAGSIIFFLLGRRVINYIHFGKAHKVHTLKVNKKLSKFYLTLPASYYSSKMENAILQKNNTNFEQKFRQNLMNNTLQIPEEINKELKASNQQKLTKQIQLIKKLRSGIILQLDREEIEKIQFITQKQMKKLIRQQMLVQIFKKKNEESILQGYSALNEKKNFILIETTKFKGWNNNSMLFIINFENNVDKKFEEYLKALAEGKKIIQL